MMMIPTVLSLILYLHQRILNNGNARSGYYVSVISLCVLHRFIIAV